MKPNVVGRGMPTQIWVVKGFCNWAASRKMTAAPTGGRKKGVSWVQGGVSLLPACLSETENEHPCDFSFKENGNSFQPMARQKIDSRIQL